MPKRIQLSRKKGWKMPYDTLNAARPTVWGNPFRVGKDGDAPTCLKYFRECLERALLGKPFPAHPNGGALSEKTMRHFEYMAKVLPDLAGGNLACWCKPGEPCHADVLLELANA